ncbi:uncharacterized protein LOC111365089 [Spodoptera litura]|uniref:Uncharacterized protein LOC111365089 n=1 Tax=Spodoptera litura TaxID=69820 RepID=A0A9J7EY11_SPOLT|nr:uncharacterized protein LOC111365089 [Spodoptera litura]
MEAIQSSVQSQEVKCSEEVSEVKSDVLVKEEDDGDEVMSKGSQRENRLTSIIDQLRCQSKLKGNVQRDAFAFTSNNGCCDVGARWRLICSTDDRLALSPPRRGRRNAGRLALMVLLSSTQFQASNMDNMQSIPHYNAQETTRAIKAP